MPNLDALNRQLKAIEDQIAEAKARMPAHSAKPGMMTELIDLEDRRDKILEEIAALQGRADKDQ
ncbi:MAG TPA: hypothetical protein VKN73_08790 [Desulfosalsimonadaceae bacterium]|nr:hypothetical protein [Desulfosalsimonadaceae bacterium]